VAGYLSVNSARATFETRMLSMAPWKNGMPPV
jgi:hypothetical protein